MSVQLQERPTPSGALSSESFVPNNRKGMLDLWSLRHLIGVMVRRDLLGQYKGSVMGFFWTIINPLGHLLLYTFVFSVILKVRFGHDASTGNFALYLMAGLLPWGALAESLNRATSAITEQTNLVKRVVFPLEILPLSVVVSSLISEVVGITLLGLVALCAGVKPGPAMLCLPLVIFSQFLFMGGLSWLLSSLGVYLRDLRHMMSLALSVWMYATPIVYPVTAFPAQLKFMVWLNPMAGIVTDYRRVLLEGRLPDWPMYAAYTCIGVVMWFVGYYFFSKTKRSFADVM